jgi:hypothetical protein
MIEAYYRVSLRTAQMCKPHAIVENLVLPTAVDMVKAVTGSEERKQM